MPRDDAATRARRRRQIRKYHDAGLSQREIARRASLNQSTVQRYLMQITASLQGKVDARTAKSIPRRANAKEAKTVVELKNAIELVEYLLREVDVEAARVLFARLERVWLSR